MKNIKISALLLAEYSIEDLIKYDNVFNILFDLSKPIKLIDVSYLRRIVNGEVPWSEARLLVGKYHKVERVGHEFHFRVNDKEYACNIDHFEPNI